MRQLILTTLAMLCAPAASAQTPEAAIQAALQLPKAPKARPYIFTERKGGEVRGVIADVVPLPIDHVLNEVLLCYGEFPDWFPLQTDAKYVTGRVGNGARIYGKMVFPWPIGKRDYQADITGSIDRSEGEAEYRIDFKHTPGTGNIKTMYGHWLLQPYGDDKTVVVYDSAIDFNTWVPGFLLARGTAQFMPAILDRMGKRKGKCTVGGPPTE